MSSPVISPLSLDQYARSLWGQYDPDAIAQLAPLAGDDCYAPKFYKAPDLASEVLAADGYLAFGLKITPGSLIYGIYLPALPATNHPLLFNCQITDQTLQHKFWDEPVPSIFLANYQTTAMSLFLEEIGSSPFLFNCPHPVVGDGLFLIELWDTSGTQQRIELVLGVLEVIG